MPNLRNNFTEISRIVHETREPVFLTKNGYGAMVVMSIEQYQALQTAKRIDTALLEAQKVAENNPVRYDFEDVAGKLRKKLTDTADKGNA